MGKFPIDQITHPIRYPLHPPLPLGLGFLPFLKDNIDLHRCLFSVFDFQKRMLVINYFFTFAAVVEVGAD